MVLNLGELDFDCRCKWLFRPRQVTGMPVVDYYTHFRVWMDEMLNSSFPAKDEDYIDGFIENLSWDIQLRVVSKCRLWISSLSDAFYNAKWEESLIRIEGNLKEIRATRVFDEIPSPTPIEGEEGVIAESVEEDEEVRQLAAHMEVPLLSNPEAISNSTIAGSQSSSINEAGMEFEEGDGSVFRKLVVQNGACNVFDRMPESILEADLLGMDGVEVAHQLFDEMSLPITAAVHHRNEQMVLPIVCLPRALSYGSDPVEAKVMGILDWKRSTLGNQMCDVNSSCLHYLVNVKPEGGEESYGSDFSGFFEGISSVLELLIEVSPFNISSMSKFEEEFVFVDIINYEFDVDCWRNGILTFIFDPGGSFSSQMGGDILKIVIESETSEELRENFMVWKEDEPKVVKMAWMHCKLVMHSNEDEVFVPRTIALVLIPLMKSCDDHSNKLGRVAILYGWGRLKCPGLCLNTLPSSVPKMGDNGCIVFVFVVVLSSTMCIWQPVGRSLCYVDEHLVIVLWKLVEFVLIPKLPKSVKEENKTSKGVKWSTAPRTNILSNLGAKLEIESEQKLNEFAKVLHLFRSVDLSGCNLGDNGLYFLVESLAYNQTAVEVNFANNGFTADALKTFDGILQSNIILFTPYHMIVVLVAVTVLKNFVWDPGKCAISVYILEDKDVLKRKGIGIRLAWKQDEGLNGASTCYYTHMELLACFLVYWEGLLIFITPPKSRTGESYNLMGPFITFGSFFELTSEDGHRLQLQMKQHQGFIMIINLQRTPAAGPAWLHTLSQKQGRWPNNSVIQFAMKFDDYFFNTKVENFVWDPGLVWGVYLTTLRTRCLFRRGICHDMTFLL